MAINGIGGGGQAMQMPETEKGFTKQDLDKAGIKMSDQQFEQIDTNNDDKLSISELKDAAKGAKAEEKGGAEKGGGSEKGGAEKGGGGEKGAEKGGGADEGSSLEELIKQLLAKAKEKGAKEAQEGKGDTDTKQPGNDANCQGPNCGQQAPGEAPTGGDTGGGDTGGGDVSAGTGGGDIGGGGVSAGSGGGV